jgi:hypothetical protein
MVATTTTMTTTTTTSTTLNFADIKITCKETQQLQCVFPLFDYLLFLKKLINNQQLY